MITLPSEFQTAYEAGNPQRMFFVFSNGTTITNEDIDVSAGVEFDEMFCSETDLTIGLCSSSEISFTLLNDDGYYSDFQFGQFLCRLGVRTKVVSNASTARRPTVTFSGRTATVIGNGKKETYSTIKMGVFIALRPDIVDVVEIPVHANDRMTLFDRNMPSRTALGFTYPVTASTLLNKMCTYLGVTKNIPSFLNSSLQIRKEPENIGDKTMREVLSWIAEIACSNARFNRAGELVFVWLNQVQKTFDESKYTGYEHAWFRTTPVDTLYVRNADSTQESVYGNGYSEYMLQDNPFLKPSSS